MLEDSSSKYTGILNFADPKAQTASRIARTVQRENMIGTLPLDCSPLVCLFLFDFFFLREGAPFSNFF